MPKRWALPLCVEQHGIRFRIDGLRGVAVADVAGLFSPWLQEQGPAFEACHRFCFSPRERTTDLLGLLGPIYARERLWPMHAGAVFCGRRGFLLAGPSGAGKSTVVRAALDMGWAIAGDDAVLLKEAAAGFDLLPWICTIQGPAPDKRPVPQPAERFSSGRLCRVLFPEVTGEPRSSVRALVRKERARRLSSQALWTVEPELLLEQGRALERLSRVPGYSLRLGDDLRQRPAGLRELLGGIP